MQTRTDFHRRSRTLERIAVALLAIAIISCSERHIGSPLGPRLVLVSGGGQHGAAGAELPAEIVVQLAGDDGRPLAGVEVQWLVGGDVLLDASGVTDAEGLARARWQLGVAPGRHVLTVTTSGGVSLEVEAWAGTSGALPLQAVSITTYDGSGQAVHPDFIPHPPIGALGADFLALTPYPQGNATYENPSVFDGGDLLHWSIPAGGHNPVVSPHGGYLSDPDAVFDPGSGEIRLYYRQVTDDNQIWLVRSADRVTWSTPVLVAHAANHAIVSPTVVRRGAGDWYMWSVNSGAAGCTASSTTIELRRSSDGVAWSAPQTVVVTGMSGWAWHLDVEWIPSRREFWALYPAKMPGGCTTAALYFARSADGLHWTASPGPLLARGALAELQDVVYRSSLSYDADDDLVTIWYSGARYDAGAYRWHVAVEQLTSSELEARVAVVRASGAADLTASPPLTNATAP
jgi:hypothetical protein